MNATAQHIDSEQHPFALELEGVDLNFDDKVILKGCDLKVRRGETKVVLGRSGAGKSTILKLALGLLRPDAGRVRVLGTDITDRREREQIRRQRVNGGAPAPRDGQLVYQAAANLDVRADASGQYWACGKCAADLGPTTTNYKEACIREDRPVSASNPLIGDPQRFIDDDVAFRQFYCRGCGTLIDNEIAVTRDSPLHDFRPLAPA